MSPSSTSSVPIAMPASFLGPRARVSPGTYCWSSRVSQTVRETREAQAGRRPGILAARGVRRKPWRCSRRWAGRPRERPAQAAHKKLRRIDVQVRVIKSVDQRSGTHFLQVGVREARKARGVESYPHARLDHVVVTVPRGVVALAEAGLVLGVGHRRVVQAVGRGKIEPLTMTTLPASRGGPSGGLKCGLGRGLGGGEWGKGGGHLVGMVRGDPPPDGGDGAAQGLVDLRGKGGEELRGSQASLRGKGSLALEGGLYSLNDAPVDLFDIPDVGSQGIQGAPAEDLEFVVAGKAVDGPRAGEAGF